jgi:hypothetical protein
MPNDSGIYFIAAGSSSNNRLKTLDKPWSIQIIDRYVPEHIVEKLKYHFPDGKNIFAWGANEKSFSELSRVKTNEYVVDIKNKEVVQLFQFCFWYKTINTSLQNLFGWDQEKPASTRRLYSYVYFLSNPRPTMIRKKEYFQSAFNLNNNG